MMNSQVVALVDAVIFAQCIDVGGYCDAEVAMLACATEILKQVRAAPELAELHGWADRQLHVISNPSEIPAAD